MKINSKFFSRNLQKYGWDCGVATVAFLLDVKGKKTSRRKIIKGLSASKDRGTDLVEIVEFFKNKSEFEAKVKDKSSLGWITKELDRGKVCLVAYQNWQKPKHIGKPDWGHYGVIYKMNAKVYLFDPGSKNGRAEFTKNEFEERWYEDDLGVHYEKWAMSLNLM